MPSRAAATIGRMATSLRAGNGREIRDFNAGIVIWEFFNKHPMPATE